MKLLKVRKKSDIWENEQEAKKYIHIRYNAF